MLISTRGRYALRIMTDIAEHCSEKVITLKEISARQEISLKYAESITADLSKAGLVESSRGKGGGYKLAVSPDKCTVKRILSVTEGSFVPVECLNAAEKCSRASECRTLPMWKKLYGVIEDFFDGITLEELCKKK